MAISVKFRKIIGVFCLISFREDLFENLCLLTLLCSLLSLLYLLITVH